MALSYAAPASAQNRRWDGSQSNTWFSAQNWTSAFIPTAADNVLITNVLSPPVSPVIAGGGAAAGTVAISDGLSLEVTAGGTLTVGNSLSVGLGATFRAHNGAIVAVNGGPDRFRVEGGTAIIDNATLTTVGNAMIGFSSTSPGSLLAVTNGAVVTVAGGTGTAFVGGSSDGTIAIGQGGTAGTINAATVNLGSAGSKVAFQHTGTTTFAPDIINLGQVELIGPGTAILTGTNTYTGATRVLAGTLQAGALNAFGNFSAATVAAGATLDLNGFSQTLGSLAGGGNVTLGTAALTTGGNDATTSFSGVIAGTGAFIKAGLGTLTLTGTNTHTGATTVAAGGLIVHGSIAASSLTAVDAGALLGGTGTVGNTTINGGTLSPGASIGTIVVQGNLTFSTAATFMVEVSSSGADRTNVTGTATLAGTVDVQFAPGGGLARRYTILSAAGGLGGTTFGALATVNLPNFVSSLSYTDTDVILGLSATLGTAGGLNGNQRSVAKRIDAFYNAGGMLPPGLGAIFGLTGGNLANALSELSGEVATGTQQGAFQLTGQFLGIMLDPFVGGRAAGGLGPALGFAPERETLPADARLAYARAMKAPASSVPTATLEQRWAVWGGASGGTNRTNGDPAVVGSHDLAARAASFAAGLDYRLAPGTVLGFALAGGGTDWSLAQGLGGGKSDAFQAGLYAATRVGPAYLAASLAFANHWMSTDRFAAFGDRLTANFNAQNIAGRIESGYRFRMSAAGVTPYTALQTQGFRTPVYSETDIGGGGFALVYDSRTASHTRGELGARFDHAAAVDPTAVLILRGRLAWAHDWVSDPTLTPTFQAMPGASFIVNGATPANDTALASAGAELRLANGIMLSARFEGEFADNAQTYAGIGALRVTW